MAENERQKLKVDEELIDKFISGRLQPSIETKLVTYFQSRPEVVERLPDARQREVQSRMQLVQVRSHNAIQALRSSLPTSLANYAGYEVTRELGRGGMGVVYLAKNVPMDRLEVLKVLNERLLDHPGAKERFLREIRAVSKLNHPNIVTSYSVLPLDRLLVFVMEYVPGVDLQKFIRTNHPVPIDQCCIFARQLAAGLQHAHMKGLVHRDIKPSNVIIYKLDNRLQLKILDFGLAKATSEEASSNLTQDGTVLGTPEYMSPEQTLDPARADIRADIYSLGCTLYHMLTGRPPFTGTHGSVLLQHSQNEAQPVNLIRPEVPVELVAVINRMLAKQPEKRFQTPSEVGQALLPFTKGESRSERISEASSRTALDLASASRDTSVVDESLQLAFATEEEPIRAHLYAQDVNDERSSLDEVRLQPIDGERSSATPQSSRHVEPVAVPRDDLRRFWMWGLPLAGLSLLLSAVVLWRLSGWISQTLQDGLVATTVEPGLTAGQQPAGAIGASEAAAETSSSNRGSSTSPGIPSADGSPAPLSPVASATVDTEAIKPATVAPQVAIPPELRDVRSPEAARLRRRLLNETRVLDNSVRGRELADQLRVATWPIDGIQRSSISAEELFAAGRGDPAAAPPELVAVLGNSRWKTADLPFATDTSISGDTVVSGESNGTITVWDPGTGRMRSQFKSSDSDLYHLKLNRSGKRLLTSSFDGVVRLWELSPPSLVRSFVGHEARVVSAVFSAEENRIYSVDEAKKLIIWDAFTAARKQTLELPAAPQESASHPTEERLVVGCAAGKVVIVDMAQANIAQAKIVEEITLGKDRISSVDFSPDGKLVAASLGDGEVQVWRADRAYEPLRKKMVPHAPLNSIHFSRDSKVLAIGSKLECWFWDQTTDTMEMHHDTHDYVLDVVPLGDRWLVSWKESHWLAVVDRAGKMLNADCAPITGATLAPDGTALAVTVRDAEQVQVWKMDSPPNMRALPGQTQWDNEIGYAIDGQRIYTAGGNWYVKVWDIAQGMQTTPFKKHENWIIGLDVASDGKHICTSGYDRTARIWDIETGNELHKLGEHGSNVPQCRYSPDASQLVTACWDGVARIWNSQSGKLIKSMPKSEGGCRAAVFQPFHRNLAVSFRNDVILYSVADATVVRTFSGHESVVSDIDFSLDGRQMVTCSIDGTLRVWDSESAELLKTITLHPRRGWLTRVRFTPDGRHVYALTGNGLVYLLRIL